MKSLSKIAGSIRGARTKAELAYEVLREAILSGVLAPGAQLSQSAVAEELDMSLIPVREALRKLEQEDLITLKPHVGATVRELPALELEENLVIRSELEALATRLAAKQIKDSDLKRLESLMTQMDQCIATGNPERYGKLNREFHMVICSAQGYERLYRLVELFWDQVPRARSVFSLVPGYMQSSQEGHRDLLEALRNHDGQRAEKLVREQKEHARDALLSVWERVYGEEAKS